MSTLRHMHILVSQANENLSTVSRISTSEDNTSEDNILGLSCTPLRSTIQSNGGAPHVHGTNR